MYLCPGSHPPLGGAGPPVAGPAGLGAVVVAVLAVDGAHGVVVRRLDAADGADLLPRAAARLAAVLPLPGHPAMGNGRTHIRLKHYGTIRVTGCKLFI